MESEQLKSRFMATFEALLPTVAEACKQLFRREFSVEVVVSEDKDARALLLDEEFPRVHIGFATRGEASYLHRITLAPDVALKLYAWMIDAEPEESLADEQLEGLQEGAKQIFGQAQAALDSEGTAFSVDDVKLGLVESPDEAAAAIPEEGGIGATYAVSAGDDSFSLGHYLWPTPMEEVSEQETAGEATPEEDLTESASAAEEMPEEELVGVHPADFDSFTSGGNGGGQPRNMEMLMDVQLEVLVELGKKTMLVRDILKLGKGSVVELEKAAGEPLEIVANGRKLAEGEVVVIDDHFGIRITQLVGPKERIKSLG